MVLMEFTVHTINTPTPGTLVRIGCFVRQSAQASYSYSSKSMRITSQILYIIYNVLIS